MKLASDLMKTQYDRLANSTGSHKVDAKFLRNQRFAKKHNLKPEEQKKRAEQRKNSKAETA
ncbi:hypothetical protein B7P43_G08551 [Cryptotermes secundus]|uniref:60S ribosomal protein L29 n=1 Tax=Cryptotermes secundus TaxID=105785 RepID=A0A2J7QEZ3_9NEOP|nr:hypothetical protein B7P43_G08551 [Cryptotermes secundus]